MPPLGGRSGWDAVLTLLGDPLGGSLDEGVFSCRNTVPPSASLVSTAPLPVPRTEGLSRASLPPRKLVLVPES